MNKLPTIKRIVVSLVLAIESFIVVNLIKNLGKLKPGKYHICILLTTKLHSFYKKHYVEIKDIVATKEKSV